MAKKSYFTYAVLGHKFDEDTKEWETDQLIQPTRVLAASVQELQMNVVRMITDEQMKKYGFENLDVIVKPF